MSLQKVAKVARAGMLRKEAGFFNNLLNTAGSKIFGTYGRALSKVPLTRGLGQRVMKESGKMLQKGLGEATAAGAKGGVSGWFNRLLAGSQGKSLAKLTASNFAANAKNLKAAGSKLAQVQKHLATPGLPKAVQSRLLKAEALYKKQVADLTKTQKGLTDWMNKNAPDMIPGADLVDDAAKVVTDGADDLARGAEGIRPMGDARAAGSNAATATAATESPVNLPDFFKQYGEGSLTRRFGETFFRDPAKATAMGLGGMWAAHNIATPMARGFAGDERYD